MPILRDCALASKETYYGRPECDRWCTDAGRRRRWALPNAWARTAARAAGRSVGAKHARRFVSTGDTLLEARGIVRTYQRGDIAVPVLKGLDLEVRRGEWVACTGRSGSGKSTLLNVLGLLDSADAGTYVLAGHDVSDLDDTGRAQLRNRLLGFVFQLHNLLPRTTALENVATPLVYRGVRRAARLRRAEAALEAVWLADRADHDPSELSGGQMQRVAIARALVGDPEVLLVDEPTGNLDLVATKEVLEILDRLHAEGRTIFMITNEEDVAEHADRKLVLSDGKLHDHDSAEAHL